METKGGHGNFGGGVTVDQHPSFWMELQIKQLYPIAKSPSIHEKILIGRAKLQTGGTMPLRAALTHTM